MASRKDIVAGGASLEIRAADFTKQVLTQVHGNITALGSSAMKFGGAMVASAGAAAVALSAFTIAAAGSAAAVDDASKRTGVAVETLQELRHGVEQSGGSFEGLIKGFLGLSKAIDTKEGRQAIEDLGLSFNAFSELSPEDRLTAIAGAIAQIDDESRQAAIAMSLFGKSGFELLPFLQEGEAGINKMRGDAHALGQVVSNEAVAALASLDDMVAKVTGSIRGLSGTLAGQLAPYLEPIGSAINSIVANFQSWLEQNAGFSAGVVGAIGAIALLGANLTTIGFVLSIVGTAFTVLGAVASSVGAIIASPFLITVAAVAAALTGIAAAAAAAVVAVGFMALPFVDLEAVIGGLGASLKWLEGLFSSVFGAIQALTGNAAQGIVDALANGEIESAGKLAFMGLQLVASKALDAMLANVRSVLKAIDNAWRSTFGNEFGFEQYFASETGLGNLEKANASKRAELQKEIEAEARLQAIKRQDREENAAEEKRLAEEIARNQAMWAAMHPGEDAATTAKAIKGATAAAEDVFSTSAGASQAGVASYLGGVNWFKPLEDEARKHTDHLAAIRKQTRNGLGVAIT